MSYCISICNQKGGTGKTTSIIELATGLAKKGKRVLVIDYDQQRNLSTYMDARSNDKTIYEVLHLKVELEDAIQHKEDIDIIPGSESMSNAAIEFRETGDEYKLADIVDLLDESYDYILIDNGPARGVLLTQSIIASNGIIMTTTCDEGGFDGMDAIERDLKKLTTGRHKYSDAKVMGYILLPYENTAQHKIALDNIKQLAAEKDPKAFTSTISKSIKMSTIKTFRTSIQNSDFKKEKPAEDYRLTVYKIIAYVEGEAEAKTIAEDILDTIKEALDEESKAKLALNQKKSALANVRKEIKALEKEGVVEETKKFTKLANLKDEEELCIRERDELKSALEEAKAVCADLKSEKKTAEQYLKLCKGE